MLGSQMFRDQRIRRVGEIGAALALVALSLTLGRVAGAAMFAARPAPTVSEDGSMPRFLMARDSDGEITSIDLASRAKPLVAFVLSVDCPYCRQNLPYWREIASELEQIEQGPDVYVLSTSGAEETAAYLERHDLPVRAMFVDQRELEALGLPGVPGTISLAPGSTRVRRVIGALGAEETDLIIAWAEAHSAR